MSRKSRFKPEVRAGVVSLRVPEGKVRRRIRLGTTLELRSQDAQQRAADRWLARHRPWELKAGDTVLFAELAENFLRLVVPRFRRSSQKRYRGTIRGHLLPTLGSIPIAQLTERRIQELLLALGARRRRTTVMRIRGVLLQVLRRGKAEGLDVADLDQSLMLPPRDNAPAPERPHITATQLQSILEAAADPWRALWATLGYSGLRIGEALALQWRHVDLDQGAIRVRQSVSLGTISPTKTRTAAADVPVAPPLVDILRAYRDQWRANEAGLLWASKAGRPLSADKVRERRWHPLLERLALPRCGIHAMRHGTASRLLELGLNAVEVQRILRHQSLAMTERYSHLPFEQLRDAMNAAYRANRSTP